MKMIIAKKLCRSERLNTKQAIFPRFSNWLDLISISSKS